MSFVFNWKYQSLSLPHHRFFSTNSTGYRWNQQFSWVSFMLPQVLVAMQYFVRHCTFHKYHKYYYFVFILDISNGKVSSDGVVSFPLSIGVVCDCPTRTFSRWEMTHPKTRGHCCASMALLIKQTFYLHNSNVWT